MRIAVVTTSYPAYDGDPSGHFVEAETLELTKAGHVVTVMCPSHGGAFGWPGASSRLREKPTRALEAAAWVAKTKARLMREHYDRVIAHWCVPSAWPIGIELGSRRASAELEVVSHGGDVRLLSRMPASLRRRIVTSVVSRAMRWRFVSDALLETLCSALDAAAEKGLRAIASVAPSPFDMIDVRDEVEEKRRSLGDRRLYVCAGRLVASKRVDKVIDYVASRDDADPVLVVLGDGPERSHLEHLAYRWRLDARFLGKTPRRETLSWIGAAHEVVHASLAEGLSTVVREAESLGVPVTLLP